MSQLTYTDQELQEINDRLWSDPPSSQQRRASVPCPTCGADTRVLISWSGTGKSCGAEVLKVNCDGCGRTGSVKPAEVQCPEFDEDQMREIVELHQRGETAFCPTCRTPLRVVDSPTLGELHYSAYCHRGGGTGQLSLVR